MFDRLRYPLLLIALLTLLAAIWAGLLRMGWGMPAAGGLAAAHGPLMVCGFLGTLIGLERAVALAALGRRWVYLAPILAALGAVTSLLVLPVGTWLLTAGSLALIAVSAEIIRRQLASFPYTMGFGAVLRVAGNILWLAGLTRPRHGRTSPGIVRTRRRQAGCRCINGASSSRGWRRCCHGSGLSRQA